MVYETGGGQDRRDPRAEEGDVFLDENGAGLMIKQTKSEPRVVQVVLYASLLMQYLEWCRPKPDAPLFLHEYNTARTGTRRRGEKPPQTYVSGR